MPIIIKIQTLIQELKNVTPGEPYFHYIISEIG